MFLMFSGNKPQIFFEFSLYFKDSLSLDVLTENTKKRVIQKLC